jgi:hypothetical protein
MKKLGIALLFAVLLSSGAFAQLMIGVSGALRMDTQLSTSEIKDRFDKGEGIFYGASIEIAGKHLGLGVAANMSYYDQYENIPTIGYYSGQSYSVNSGLMSMVDYDITLYLSYHLFGARKIIDPFGEFGGGLLATGFANSSDNDAYNPYDSAFFMAKYYWYAGFGLGLNLGIIGVFAKLAYNYPLAKKYETNFQKSIAGGGSAELYPYGYDSVLFPDGYVPKYRLTLGAKLIL